LYHVSSPWYGLGVRAVAQRVSSASVVVDAEVVGAIERGLLVYLGAGRGDDDRDADYVANKLAGLRIWADDSGRMTLSVEDVGGAVLVISQFTLFGDVRRGRRPSFDGAAEPEEARLLLEKVCVRLRDRGLTVATGRFRASMEVRSAVDGPVTIMIDSKKTF
jgi:D-tyrosyl-tRNA(Tyr) deacylase